MAFENLKARLGIGGRTRQYVDVESVRDLEDVSDPETVEDESHTSIREWAAQHKVLTVVLGLVGTLVVGIALFWAARIAPGVLFNENTLRVAVVATVFGVGYRYGWQNRGERHFGWDELNLKMNGKALAMKGVYIDDLPSDADGFIPIKGWRYGAHKAVPYTNGDLGAAMVESYNAYMMGDDDAAIIRLRPTETEVAETDWGTRVIAETGGLEPDPDGNHTSLKATYPDYDDDRANELAAQLDQVTIDYYDVVEENQGLRRRVKELKDRLTDPIEDEVDKRINQFAKMRDAVHGHRRRRDDTDGVGPQPHDFKGNGTTPPASSASQQETEEVEQEVSSDD